MINVYIVSGFLGAGKTTFIQKLLSEKKFEKVMLLENEFGEVGVDGAFFDKSLNIREINNGCICCSLQGDFEDALEEIEEMGVTDLLIEPSGVGKLSEIINVVKGDPDFRIVSHICIVDVKTCRKYHINFKEYFNDQVAAANAIILSHTDVADEETIEKAKEIVRELNEDAEIVEHGLSDEGQQSQAGISFRNLMMRKKNMNIITTMRARMNTNIITTMTTIMTMSTITITTIIITMMTMRMNRSRT